MVDLSHYCARSFSREEMTNLEGWILSVFGYDMSFPDIAYAILAQALDKESLEKGERLLGLAVGETEIMK
jgi:hypothetical protein